MAAREKRVNEQRRRRRHRRSSVNKGRCRRRWASVSVTRRGGGVGTNGGGRCGGEGRKLDRRHGDP
ncbi:hypothetical protein M8494_16965 [Serratia ureilytica]